MIRGVDVSKWQRNRINWPKLAAEGFEFAYIRAAYGKRLDETFSQHFRDAVDVGMVPGPYLFVRHNGQSAEEQWGAMQRQTDATDAHALMLVPALDLEDNSEYDGELDVVSYQQLVDELIDRAVAEYGRVVCYVNPGMIRILQPETFVPDDRLLWIAHWNVPQPEVPIVIGEGGNKQWTFWQDQVKTIPGVVTGEIDHNWFDGTAAELPMAFEEDLGDEDEDTIKLLTAIEENTGQLIELKPLLQDVIAELKKRATTNPG